MKSSQDTLKQSKQNAYGQWKGNLNGAKERILKKVCVPMGRQSFKAKPDSTFFAIGSCFARNVEERLELAGAAVTSRNINVRDLGAGTAREGGIFNKYTPYSILQELQWASGEADFPDDAFLALGAEGEYYDSQLRSKAGRGSLEALRARREEVKHYFSQAFDADIIVITLGLIEVWYDNVSGLYLNEAPNPRLLMRDKDRFSFKCMSVVECKKVINEIHALLKRHSKKSQRIVMTVSPVPLGRTFSNDDIIIANTTSKSTLRVAALEFINRRKGIDYFPSYEAVLHSHPDVAWQKDRLHVSDFIVGQIIQTFLYRYGVSEIEASFETLEIETESTDEAHILHQLTKELNYYKNQLLLLEGKDR